MAKDWSDMSEKMVARIAEVRESMEQTAKGDTLQTKQNYIDVTRYFTDLVIYLQKQGALCDGDCDIMAAQLCLPITVWINLCDREPEREAEIMELVEKHIRQFFKLYRTKA